MSVRSANSSPPAYRESSRAVPKEEKRPYFVSSSFYKKTVRHSSGVYYFQSLGAVVDGVVALPLTFETWKQIKEMFLSQTSSQYPHFDIAACDFALRAECSRKVNGKLINYDVSFVGSAIEKRDAFCALLSDNDAQITKFNCCFNPSAEEQKQVKLEAKKAKKGMCIIQ